MSLLIFVVRVVLVLLGATLGIGDLRLGRRSKSDGAEIWPEIGKIIIQVNYASTDGVGFSIRRYGFKMAAMTSFRAEKGCHLVSEQEAFAHRQCSSLPLWLSREDARVVRKLGVLTPMRRV